MNTLPENIQLRPPTMADLSAIVKVINAHEINVFGYVFLDEAEFKHEWETPGLDLSADARVAVTPAGTIIGYVHLIGLDPYVTLSVFLNLYPDYQRAEVAQPLLAWAESRAGQFVALAPAEARIALHAEYSSKDLFLQSLFEGAGYHVIRHAQDMKIHFTDAPPEPIFPPNITLKTFDRETHMRPLFKAAREAFRDHFGFIPTPDEEAFARFVHRTETADFDPNIWFIAMDGDEVAGMSLCRSSMPEDQNLAWVETLAVRRPWRRQGLALALLHHTFSEFYRRGKSSVALGVDSQSLTGATRLYEKAGMHMYQQFDILEKVLREGVEFTTTTIES
jgi:mycothiol synthase